MQQHQILLSQGLYRNKMDPGTGRRFTDRQRIAGVILVHPDEGLHVLRRDQPDLMPQGLEQPPPVVSTATDLHRDEGWRQLPHLVEQPGSLHRSVKQHLAMRTKCAEPKDILCQINPKNLNIHGGRLLYPSTWTSHTQVWRN